MSEVESLDSEIVEHIHTGVRRNSNNAKHRGLGRWVRQCVWAVISGRFVTMRIRTIPIVCFDPLNLPLVEPPVSMYIPHLTDGGSCAP